MYTFMHTLSTSHALACARVFAPQASTRALPTRNDCLDALARHGYGGPTSYTARDLRPLAAWAIALTHITGRPVSGGTKGATRTDCLVALRDLGWTGPTSYTARDLRWLVAAVYAETNA